MKELPVKNPIPGMAVPAHSVRKDFTGFESAASRAWKLIANNAMNIADTAFNETYIFFFQRFQKAVFE
jgi:hypothetical protein